MFLGKEPDKFVEDSKLGLHQLLRKKALGRMEIFVFLVVLSMKFLFSFVFTTSFRTKLAHSYVFAF